MVSATHSFVISLREEYMAKQLDLKGRQFLILSEPIEATGWKATVV
jgi:hypothetical protein